MSDGVPGNLSASSICVLVRAMAGGGAQRDAVLLANGLAARGVVSVIVTLDASGPLNALVAPGVPVVDLGRGRKLRLAAAIPALRRFLLKARPRAFVASEASGNAIAVLATRTLTKSRRPALILREVASPLQARRTDPYRQNRIAYALAPLLYPRADLVVALTEPARRDLVNHFNVPDAKAARLGTNSIFSAAEFARLSATPRAQQPGLVAAVGRLSPEKDFATLIEAIARVGATMPVQLEIAGEGPERPALEALIVSRGLSQSVKLLGFQSDPTPLLLRCAAFVSSSRYEGFGNSIVEAMAAGATIVATDAPYGPREVLDGGRFGRLVPVGDTTALAAAITAALESPADPSTVRAHAAKFTAEAAADALLALMARRGL